MPKVQTQYINLNRLGSRIDAAKIVRLMMAFNDMVLANRAARAYKGDLNPTEKHLAKGANMYFIRLQMSHLSEGMKILSGLDESPGFQRILSSCSEAAQAAYRRLALFAYDGPQKTWFVKHVARARHGLTFHYEESEKMIDWALKDRASRPEAELSSITVGDHGHLWRFHVADDVVDSILCRKIWQIPRNTDLRKEADEMADKIYSIYCDFVDFAGPFVLAYLR